MLALLWSIFIIKLFSCIFNSFYLSIIFTIIGLMKYETSRLVTYSTMVIAVSLYPPIYTDATEGTNFRGIQQKTDKISSRCYISCNNVLNGGFSMFDALRKNCRILAFSAAILYLFSTIGYVIEEHQLKVVEKVKVTDDKTARNPKDSFLLILKQNLISFILMSVIGALTFGAFTLTNLCVNSVHIGQLLKMTSSSSLILLILPHGIFEIPAIIIAGAAGFKIPYEIIRYLAGKKETILTKQDIKEYLILTLISIVLIVIAAWVEANITLKIAKAMLNNTI